MMEEKKTILRAGLNRMLEDGYKKINASHLYIYSKHDSQVIEESIKEWSERGILKILKPYHECAPDDCCVEMLRFIDQKSPIKGYMNWESD